MIVVLTIAVLVIQVMIHKVVMIVVHQVMILEALMIQVVIQVPIGSITTNYWLRPIKVLQIT